MLKIWLAGLIKPYKKWEPWSEEMMLWMERELNLMGDSDPDYHRLYAQYVINQFKPITVIKTNKDYENVVTNLSRRIHKNIANHPEQSKYSQQDGLEIIRTYDNLLAAKKRGIKRVRGIHEYVFCKKCREKISKIFFIDDLLKEYNKPIDSVPPPIIIPCSAGAADSDRECFCSWQVITEPGSGVDLEFSDWLDKFLEKDIEKR